MMLHPVGKTAYDYVNGKTACFCYSFSCRKTGAYKPQSNEKMKGGSDGFIHRYTENM